MKRLFLLLLLAGFSFADSLSVEKLIDKSTPTAGDSMQVLLKFSNPFGQQLPIRIVDKNVFGGNGIDVQCLEYTLPADRTVTIAYEGIQAFQPGSFTLGNASITYTNPQTGKDETISSNSLGVVVAPNPSGQPVNAEGITTIYECGGTSMKSTSFSTSSQQQLAQQTQSRLQGMQQQNMQDMDSLRQQMEEQQKQENELKNRIEQDPEFRKMQDELQKQGYAQQRSQINPEPQKEASSQERSQSQSPNPQQQAQAQNPSQSQASQQQPQNQNAQPSASFQYDFQKPTGENATIQGRLEGGNITSLSKWSAEDERTLLEKVSNSTQFQHLAQSLSQQGFNLTGAKASMPSGNLSQFTYSYSNLNETRNITGTATPQGKVTSITIEQPRKTSDTLFWLVLLLLLLLACLLYPKKPVQPQPLQQARPNFRREALSMIAQAEALFSENKQKEAFSLLSEAVRFYFKHISGTEKREFSSSDVLAYIKSRDRRRLSSARSCLGMCDLVAFAKFSPQASDFRRASALARKLVSKKL